ncbi:MAG: hypothetical protein JSS35_17120, partial [Proteobacteria bacterium]|nr:hypothetical protein [Pseudomonadota bacterium]
QVAKAAMGGELGALVPAEGRHAVVRPADLLRVLWPAARRIMAAPMPLEFADEPPLHDAHWPVILAGVAARLMAQLKDQVPAPVAAGLVMEGAIVASKLDPDLAERGRWLLAPGPRGLQISRDDRRRVA